MQEAEFRNAIADHGAPPPHPRFGVYRNNVTSALINALRVRYPMTAKLLGSPAFGRVAGDFALSHLPRSAVLIEYGAEFPDRLPKPVADVARLENLWWSAYHAAEATPMDPARLTALPPEELEAVRFAFHPSVGLMTSEFNAGSVWEAARAGGEPEFREVTQHLLVARPHADVAVKVLPAPSFDFLSALHHGSPLGAALADCATRHSDFDFAAEIAGLLSHQIITGV